MKIFYALFRDFNLPDIIRRAGSIANTVITNIGTSAMRLGLVTVVSILMAVSCSGSSFTGSERNATAKPLPSQTAIPADPIAIEESSGDANISIQRNKVALAAKHFACTICHAKFDGNVVTDFFIDINERSAAQTFSAYAHPGLASGRHARSFQLNGDFIIPKGDVSIADTQVTGGSANCSWEGIYIDRPTV